jgi:Sulfite oxidase and related enzymes
MKSTTGQVGTLDQQRQALQAVHPLDPLCDLLVTPLDQFFVHSHGSVPAIDPTSFRLSVTGDVVRPLRFSLNDLRERFSRITILSTMRCGGSECRNLADPHSPGSESSEFGRASGNAIWGGASLQQVLLAAGIENSARYAVFTGLDPIEVKTQRTNYSSAISIETALRPEVLLAYEMNGQPLTPEHGAPLRLIVPSEEGARGVKWLAEIKLLAYPLTNNLQTRFCNIIK